jgi:valyl-tRNA synthetase
MVTDEKGAKMSKSKGNVVNPIDLVQKYGADALRIALVAGSAPGNPIALSENKVKGYRNFSNKLWNIARFILLKKEELGGISTTGVPTEEDQKLLSELETLTQLTTSNLEKYRFSDAALSLYDFVWNRVASDYLEKTKNREDKDVVLSTLLTTFSTCLKMLHPFMPFVTESIWSEWKKGGLINEKELLIISSWPTVS